MEEQAEDTISETTMSDDNENAEWEDIFNLVHDPDNESINPNESVSQISQITSDISETSGSTVWIYFDKNPSYAQGFNVCKKCSNKYSITTSVTTLRTHLKKHQIKTPIKKKNVVMKKKEPFDEMERKEHDDHLVEWLVCDLQPFTVVDNKHFRKFLSFFCPRYDIPDRHKVKGKVCFDKKRFIK